MGDISPIVKVSSRIYGFYGRIQNMNSSLLPKSLEMHLSNICNHSCKFCFYQDDRFFSDRISFLPTERIMSILTSFKGEKDISLVLSGGGEPTLHPHFSEIIHKAIDVGFDVGVITNGLHYNKKIEEALLRTKWVKFSLHSGNPETYQKLMYHNNGVEIFDRVQRHIQSLVMSKSQNTKVSTGCVITQKNQSDQEILSYFNNAIDFLHVDYVLFRGYMGNDTDLKITRSADDFKAVGEIIKQRSAERGIFSNFSSFIRDFNLSRHYLDGICPIISSGLIAAITTDGNVHVCLPSAQNESVPSIGSILTQDFKDIWNGDLHKSAIKNLSLNSCPPCKYERMFPLIEKITSQNSNIIQEEIKARLDPHWRFL